MRSQRAELEQVDTPSQRNANELVPDAGHASKRKRGGAAAAPNKRASGLELGRSQRVANALQSGAVQATTLHARVRASHGNAVDARSNLRFSFTAGEPMQQQPMDSIPSMPKPLASSQGGRRQMPSTDGISRAMSPQQQTRGVERQQEQRPPPLFAVNPARRQPPPLFRNHLAEPAAARVEQRVPFTIVPQVRHPQQPPPIPTARKSRSNLFSDLFF
jgi:hypothetical protein